MLIGGGKVLIGGGEVLFGGAYWRWEVVIGGGEVLLVGRYLLDMLIEVLIGREVLI